MKKSIIALALLGLSGAASAEVVLYGAVKAGVEWERGFKGRDTPSPERAFGVTDYGSRIGFRGSEELGGGLKAVWQIETAASVGNGTVGNRGRDSFVGLEGGFGRVTAGYESSPLKRSLDEQDIWEYSNQVLGLHRYTRFSFRKTGLTYQSPDWGGFDFSVQVAPGNNIYGGSGADSEPSLGLGLNYRNSGFFGRYALEYALRDQERHRGKDAHIHNLVGGYDGDRLYLALGLQYAKNVAPYFSRPNNVTLSPADNYINYVYGTATLTDGLGNTHDILYDATTKEAQLTAAYRFGALRPKLSVAYGTSSGATVLSGGRAGVDARYLQVVTGADYAFSRRTTGLVSLGWIRDRVSSSAGYYTNWAVGTGLVHKF